MVVPCINNINLLVKVQLFLNSMFTIYSCGKQPIILKDRGDFSNLCAIPIMAILYMFVIFRFVLVAHAETACLINAAVIMICVSFIFKSEQGTLLCVK